MVVVLAPWQLGVKVASGSKVTETKEAGKALPAAIENFPETEVKPVVHLAIGKPSISGLPFHNHNILVAAL